MLEVADSGGNSSIKSAAAFIGLSATLGSPWVSTDPMDPLSLDTALLLPDRDVLLSLTVSSRRLAMPPTLLPNVAATASAAVGVFGKPGETGEAGGEASSPLGW